jgi:uncharacterized protein YlxW (UPF0749 family)
MTDRPGGRPESGSPSYVGLLTELMTNTLDEDYRAVATREAAAEGRSGADTRSGLSRRVGALAAVAAFGVLMSVSALKTAEERPQTLAERDQLIDQIEARQARLDSLHETLASREAHLARLQQQLAHRVSTVSRLDGEIETLAVNAGMMAVSGPGLVITVDDAQRDLPGTGGRILDSDLQALVNGLWAAGAEAIAIDDHRLTALTSIRFAGQAITVDYRSLTPPYVVEAVGDPNTLPARFLESPGGQFWLGLRANFGVTFDTETHDNLVLPGDTHDHLLWAAPASR